ncbi:Zinc/iron permease [Coniochaeta sp. 2T2.1]|nr:Zinc/iron permease [Coniochaeta sp. 2T2.1]
MEFSAVESLRALLMAREEDPEVPACAVTENDTSKFGLRIASIFVILVGSALGAIAPIMLARSSSLRVPKLAFFIAKYFGSGVIISTAWMHLLSPASEALGDPCLGNILPEYDWAMGIGLMTVMVMFLIELIVSRFDWGFSGAHSHDHSETEAHDHSALPSVPRPDDLESTFTDKKTSPTSNPGPFSDSRIPGLPDDVSYPPGGQDHLGHQREHVEGQETAAEFAAQMTALFILEFGVIFHSIFIGLTLAISDNFVVLFIVLVFHQTFEGLGLGSRLATATWPSDRRRWMPYLLGGLYAITTPVAIGIGLGVRESLQTSSEKMLLINGIFDAISGGILMYTGLVELLAHEFMFNPQMRNAGLRMQLFAYACVATGVALMALLAKWA